MWPSLMTSAGACLLPEQRNDFRLSSNRTVDNMLIVCIIQVNYVYQSYVFFAVGLSDVVALMSPPPPTLIQVSTCRQIGACNVLAFSLVWLLPSLLHCRMHVTKHCLLPSFPTVRVIDRRRTISVRYWCIWVIVCMSGTQYCLEGNESYRLVTGSQMVVSTVLYS